MHTPVYLDTPSTVDSFLASIGDTPILALDTEGASFHRFVDRIYLLQLSTREQTAIIDPIPIGSPRGLGTLLEDPAVHRRHDAATARYASWVDPRPGCSNEPPDGPVSQLGSRREVVLDLLEGGDEPVAQLGEPRCRGFLLRLDVGRERRVLR